MQTGNALPSLALPAVALPPLGADGTVRFDTAAMLEACWDAYVQRGALAVRPERPLSPLEQLDVHLVGAYLTEAISLRCEVVHLDPQRALLRLLDAPPPRPVPAPPARVLSGPTTTQDVVIGQLMPGPEGADDPRPLVDVALPAPTVASSTPSPGPAATAAAPLVGPVLDGDVLRFATLDDLQAARPHLEDVGAILAACAGSVPLAAVEVRLSVADRVAPHGVRAMVAAASPGMVVVQAVEKGAFAAVLAALGAASTQWVPPVADAPPVTALPRSFTPGSQSGAKSFTLSKSGEIQNPTTPAGILGLPLVRGPTEAEIARPSVPLLLRWLRTLRGAMKLEITAADQPLFTAVFVDGREVRSPASMATLGKSLSSPQMSYSIVDLGRAPQLTTVGRTLHLIGEVVRGLCARCEVDDLQAAFPDRAGKCPRAVAHIVESLGMPPQHQRFVKADVDGQFFLEEAARAAVGARTVWEALYLLELYQGLEWEAPSPDKKPRTGAHSRSGLHALKGLVPDEEGVAFDGKDHFQVLGLHWSSPPSEVGPAVSRLRSDYGPGGKKRPTNAAAADKLSKRIEEAYRVLSNDEQRRRYRRDHYNLVWPHQAQLLVQKAKIALYRKDYDEAREILETAEDISPSPEAKALLAGLNRR
jgi:hypothetical protein